jgi:hypothetical protein
MFVLNRAEMMYDFWRKNEFEFGLAWHSQNYNQNLVCVNFAFCLGWAANFYGENALVLSFPGLTAGLSTRQSLSCLPPGLPSRAGGQAREPGEGARRISP